MDVHIDEYADDSFKGTFIVTVEGSIPCPSKRQMTAFKRGSFRLVH